MKHIYKITQSYEETIPTVQYGNKKVGSKISREEITEKELTNKQIQNRQDKLNKLTREICDKEAELVRGGKDKLPSHHRVSVINGKPCPHVTNINDPRTPEEIAEEIHMSVEEFKQHGFQGTWMDGCSKNLVRTGILYPKEEESEDEIEVEGGVRIPKNKTPLLKVTNAQLFHQLETWVSQYVVKGKIEFTRDSIKVFNKKHWFCGEIDAIGLYYGKPAIFDFKKTKKLSKDLIEKYFMQMAAYSMSDDLPISPSFLVICSPYNPPIATESIKEYQEKFLQKRKKYEQKYKL